MPTTKDSPLRFDLSTTFEPATALSARWLNALTELPYKKDASLRSGDRYDKFVSIDGVSFSCLKARRLTLDSNASPTPSIVMGPYSAWGDAIPRAFFLIAETLVIRLTGTSIRLNFSYSASPPPPRPADPTWQTPDPLIGANGNDGFPGAPLQSAKAFAGPPVYIFFKKLDLRGNAEPNDRWLQILAEGADGQDGSNGGPGGMCPCNDFGCGPDPIPCRVANGRGGRGGDAAHGFGGGQFFVYAPATEYDRFRDASQFFHSGGQPGTAGQPGAVTPPFSNPKDGGPGAPGWRGHDGDIDNIPTFDVSTLFPPQPQQEAGEA